jgi:hypothetical protein
VCLRCSDNIFIYPQKDTHTDTQTDGEKFIKYGVEMGSGPIMYMPSFVKIGSGIQKLIGGYTGTQRAW